MTLDLASALANLPASLIVGLAGLLVLVILALPLALRVAGLTGQQIADLLGLTMQFFINLLHEFRAQNKSDNPK